MAVVNERVMVINKLVNVPFVKICERVEPKKAVQEEEKQEDTVKFTQMNI